MRLAAITIANFRCYQPETRIELDDLTMLVGRNDSGKSAILEALAIYFDAQPMDGDDRCNRSNEKEVAITAEFVDIPGSLVLDTSTPTTLAAEYLLSSQGRLVVRRVFHGAVAKPKPLRTVAVAHYPTAEDYSDLHSLTNAKLKQRAAQLGVALDGIDPKQNPPLRHAIWAHSPDLALAETEVALDADNSKAIWKSLSAALPTFALFKSDRASTDQDSEAQDPLKAAIKEALASKQADLDALATYVEAEVRAVAEATVSKLKEMDPSAAADLAPQFKTPNWSAGFKVSLTDEADIPINKRGSGVRRLILLNFFRAKAEQAATDEDRPGVIYAVEEPETSQHPDNQLLLLSAFEDLASIPGNQVVLTSHTPVLARRLPESAIRYVEKHDDRTRTIHPPSPATNQLVAAALGVLPDHNVRVFFGVEGKNDIEFFKRISAILYAAGEAVPDLAAEESAGKLIFIPLGGSSLALWVDRLRGLNRPEFHVFDRDTEPPAPPKYVDAASQLNAKANSTAVIASKLELENYIHPDAIAAARQDLSPIPQLGDFVDVPVVLAQHIHALFNSPTPWSQLDELTKKKKESKVKSWLNKSAVDNMTPALLTAIDPDDDIRGWLRALAHHL